MCVLWLPLEASAADEGIAFVRGSHLWDKLFMRVFFKDPEEDRPQCRAKTKAHTKIAEVKQLQDNKLVQATEVWNIKGTYGK